MLVFFVVAIIVIGLIFGIKKAVDNKKHKQESQLVFDNLQDFKADSYYLSKSSGVSIGFDNQRKKICFLDKTHNPAIFDYSKILQCELIIDGDAVLQSSTSGTIGRALLGGILGGGVGAIVGGTTGSKKQKEEISSIDLKVIVNDTSNPVYRVNFLDVKTKKGSLIYQNVYPNAERWHAIVSGLIRQGNDEDKNTASQVFGLSVADELKKLKDLRDGGIITDEEFSKQKAKLIG